MQNRELNTCKQDIYSFLHFSLPTNTEPSKDSSFFIITLIFELVINNLSVSLYLTQYHSSYICILLCCLPRISVVLKDYSSIRFLKKYLPDYCLPNQKATIRIHHKLLIHFDNDLQYVLAARKIGQMSKAKLKAKSYTCLILANDE